MSLPVVMENSDLATQTKVVMPCSLSHVMVMIRQLLLLSGDVELNPGPLDRGRLLYSIIKICVYAKVGGGHEINIHRRYLQ